MMEIINSKKENILNFKLTDSYRGKGFAKNFSSHVNGLFDLINEINSSDKMIEEVELTDRAYFEMESHVFEKLNLDLNEEIEDEIDIIEESLYENINNELKLPQTDIRVEKMIDNTVASCLNWLRFELLPTSNEYINPWLDASNILIENNMLYLFSSNTHYLKNEYDIDLANKNESEEVRLKKVGIVGKGNRDDFTYGSYRDILALRATVYNLIDDKAPTSENPIIADKIIEEIRLMGIPEYELTDANIKTWLIYPLKRASKIGSCREGYFILKDCGDIIRSYESHLNQFKGYLNTLNRHKALVKRNRFECDYDFDKHKNL